MPHIVSDIVEVVVFRFARTGPEFLLLRRAADEQVFPGIWQVLTGTVNEGETALAAARREVEEETGLKPSRFWIVPYVGTFYEPHADAIHHCPFFAAQVGPSNEPALSPEHQAHRWLPLGEATAMLVWPSQRAGLSIANQSIVKGELAESWLRISP